MKSQQQSGTLCWLKRETLLKRNGKSRVRSATAAMAALLVAGMNAGQVAPTAAPTPDVRPGANATVATGPDEEPIQQLSPFEVNASQDRGYFAPATMSGTRLNSNLADVPAAITVVNKQQLLDTAATDINDVFMYEVSTEGIYQWTSFNVEKGGASDDVAASPTTATRMRGLTSANNSIGGYETSLPFDTYNVDAVEISRGPNSSLFGIGMTGGTVNILGSRANLTRQTTTVAARGDSYGGYRGNFDLNRPILKDRLAVRLLGVYEEKGFERKPSADTTRRLQVALTAKPTRSTTLRGSFESYRNFANRPNSTTPRDMVTDWEASGKPTYDPLTRIVHFGDGRPAIGPISNLQQALLPFGIAPLDTLFFARPNWYIDNGKVQLYMVNGLPAPGNTAFGPDNTGQTGAYPLQNSTFYEHYPDQYPLFMTKGITDRSLYDWRSINLLTPNYAWTTGETSNVELEQFFLQSPRQTLALQAGWLRERTGNNNASFLARTDNGKTQVFIDVSERLLDGTPNPYLLRPYLFGTQPRFTRQTSVRDTYRGTLAYQLDLSTEKSWLRWLGRHNFAGYSEYREILTGNFSFVDEITSTEAWMNPLPANFNRTGAGFRINPRYYVGSANGGRVEYAPQPLGPPSGSYTLRYQNVPDGPWIDEPVEVGREYFSGGYSRRLLSTRGGTWQGYFLGGRVVAVLGQRWDANRSRGGDSPIAPSAATNGFYDTSPLSSFTTKEWVQHHGKTTTAGVVVKPFRWLRLAYNQANSFIPGEPRLDAYLQPLPNPRGETKDYGFDLDLFPDASGQPRLSLRAKQYETLDSGRNPGISGTITMRALRIDYDRDAAGAPELAEFFRTELAKLHPMWSAAEMNTEIVRLMGIDPGLDEALIGNRGDVDIQTARGREIEIAFNPTRTWTLKANVTQTKAFNGMMSDTTQQFIAERLQVWTTATSPADGSSYWDHPTFKRGGRNAHQYYDLNILGPLKLALAQQGKLKTQLRQWRGNIVTSYKLSGLTDHQWLKNATMGGAVRWESKASIGYLGAPPDSDGIIRELDRDKPVWDKARSYFDLMAGYDLRLFAGRVRTRLQLNVRNLLEDGRLQPIAVNPDGTPWAFRIIDPRQFIFSATFSL